MFKKCAGVDILFNEVSKAYFYFMKNISYSFFYSLNSVIFLCTIFAMLTCCSCNNSKQITNKNDVSILPRSSWNALFAKSYKGHKPIRITVHHEGTKLEITDDAAKKINAIQRWGMGEEKKWTDIPYHFLIAPNGNIYEGRDVFTVGETSTEYDPTGHLLICCLGNRNESPVPKEQLYALVKLIKYSSKKYKIPLDSIGTHKNFSKQTTCPGKYLEEYFLNGFIMKEAKK